MPNMTETQIVEYLNSFKDKQMNLSDFEYGISLLSNITNSSNRLHYFNSFMNTTYIKVAQNNTDSALKNVIEKNDISEPLADFIKNFGSSWPEIKKNLSSKDLQFISNALAYARNPIKFVALKDSDLDISHSDFLELIKSLNLDDQKEYFLTAKPEDSSKSKSSNLPLSLSEKADVLCAYKYDSRKTDFLQKHFADVSFPKDSIVKIASSIQNDKIKARFLRPINVEAYKFTNVDCTKIINSLQFDSNKINILNSYLYESNDHLNLENDQLVNIISNLEKDKNKLDFLSDIDITQENKNDGSNKSKLIDALQKKGNLALRIYKDDIRKMSTEIIRSLNKDTSKLDILLNPKKIEKLGLRNYNLAYITSTLEADSSKQKIINEAKKLNLNVKNITRIVSSFQSDKLKIEFLNNPPQGISTAEKARIVSTLSNSKDVEKYISTPEFQPYKNAILLGMHNNSDSISKTQFDEVATLAGINPTELHNLPIPTLPNNMTIGVELETVGLNDSGNATTSLLKDFRTVLGNFQAKTDTSLHGYKDHAGVEVISPILKNNNLENLNLVATLLQKNNLSVNETCGAHVHIGADYLDSIEAWKNLCEIWGNNEDLMYQITNQAGTGLRGGVKEYARAISPKIAEAIQSGSIDLQNEDDLDHFIDEIKHLQYGKNKEFEHIVERGGDPEVSDFHKYYGLNFKNINSVHKNTIEFRLPNGTVDPETLMQNINLFSSVVRVSKELADAEKLLNSGEPLTKKQKELMLARQALVSSNKDNPDQRMDALMNLLFTDDEKSQEYFIDRYKEFPRNSLEGIKFGRFDYRKFYNLNSQKISEFQQEVTQETPIKDLRSYA